MKRIFSLLTAITVVILGWSSLTAQESYTMRGTATESSTKVKARPLAGATVQVLPGGYRATTDASGAYSIPGIPRGSYSVRVTAPGHLTISQRLSLVSDKTVDFNLTIAKVGGPYTVSGKVTASNVTTPSVLEQVSGAVVTLTPKKLTATSDAGGAYNVVNVYAGKYTVKVVATGFKPYTQKLTVKQDTVLNLTLTRVSGEKDPEVTSTPRRKNR